eukprot:1275939-Karenia_brevis.AAC.1
MATQECTRHFYSDNNSNTGVHKAFLLQQQRQHWSAQGISTPTTAATLECTKHFYLKMSETASACILCIYAHMTNSTDH